MAGVTALRAEGRGGRLRRREAHAPDIAERVIAAQFAADTAAAAIQGWLPGAEGDALSPDRMTAELHVILSAYSVFPAPLTVIQPQ
jgi:hypothetical protein